jgi:dihydrofolate synthase/folylpolyglutamate synthase
MDYRESLDWLYSTQMFGIKLGLENAHRLVAALDCYPTGRVIHVAGTNGKGSVCAMAESIARAAGYRTGLFTSPHLVHYNERIKINGIDASNPEISGILSYLRQLVSNWQPHPTFFEISTALALLLFKIHGCEVILLETGMGGRLDATNIVTPAVSVLTKIDFDHAQWLGETLEKIAREKAGIIKPRVPALTYPQTPEVLAVFQQAAEETQSHLTVLDTPYDASPAGLPGEHQKWNAALAVHALQISGLNCEPDAITEGLRQVSWPGRFQEIQPGIFLDGAHNPAAAKALADTWRSHFPEVKPTILIGMVADKDIAQTLSELSSIAASWIAVAPNSPRSLPVEDLASQIRLVSQAAVITSSSLAETLTLIPAPLLICGSLFLVGEALAFYHQQPATRTSAQ